MGVNIPAGYKQTEVGVIPEDWEVTALTSLCTSILDCHHSTPVWIAAGALVLRNQNIRNGKLDLSVPSFTDEQHFFERTRRATPTFGDLVITREAPMGQVCAIPKDLKCCLGQRMVLIRPTQDAAVSNYLLYCLQSEVVQRAISIVGGTGSTVSNLRIPALKGLWIALPELAEQDAIAEALSDADALIDSLDQLITKKRQIKQGAMQELLTGKRRLPGFGGEWEVKRLGALLTIRHGKSQKGVESINGAYPILATGGQIGRADQFLSDGPSVLIGRKGTIDQPQYMDTPFWTVDTLFYSDIHPKNNAKFLFYRFCLIDWKQYNEASGVPSLNARTIENVEVLCPEPTEQTAIATVLSDMDTELAALEARLAKARQIKQGMMQALLTGRIRLL